MLNRYGSQVVKVSFVKLRVWGLSLSSVQVTFRSLLEGVNLFLGKWLVRKLIIRDHVKLSIG